MAVIILGFNYKAACQESAVATHTGLEPVFSCVTGRRIDQLSQ